MTPNPRMYADVQTAVLRLLFGRRFCTLRLGGRYGESMEFGAPLVARTSRECAWALGETHLMATVIHCVARRVS
jgi:hypothetical protein